MLSLHLFPLLSMFEHAPSSGIKEYGYLNSNCWAICLYLQCLIWLIINRWFIYLLYFWYISLICLIIYIPYLHDIYPLCTWYISLMYLIYNYSISSPPCGGKYRIALLCAVQTFISLGLPPSETFCSARKLCVLYSLPPAYCTVYCPQVAQYTAREAADVWIYLPDLLHSANLSLKWSCDIFTL